LLTDVLSRVIDLDAFKRLAEFGGLADDSKELDFHWDEVSVLAESVGLLSEACWL